MLPEEWDPCVERILPMNPADVARAIKTYKIDVEKANPVGV